MRPVVETKNDLPIVEHKNQLAWERWLERDPVRMASRHVAELQGLGHIHVEAGRSDEYMLDVGSGAFSRELTRLGVAHSFELFDGRHSGVQYRYPPAVRDLLLKLEGLEG